MMFVACMALDIEQKKEKYSACIKSCTGEKVKEKAAKDRKSRIMNRKKTPAVRSASRSPKKSLGKRSPEK